MKILLAVSGGIDSMYMANRAPELFPGACFAVAHCNFHLRGEESDGDAAFVQAWCRERGLECFCADFDTLQRASEAGVSVEMAARELRYKWFLELCLREGFGAVAVAHNANDNAETLLLNMLRGCGSKGMCAMDASSKLLGTESVMLLRPLLGTLRGQIREYMVSKGLEWREDSSNAQSDYRRNLLRNKVFPLLESINPSAVSTLCSDISRLRQTQAVADDYFEAALESICAPDGSVDVRALLALRHWKYVLWRLLEDSGISSATLEKMYALLERYGAEPAGTVTLSGKVFQTPKRLISFVGKRMVVRPR